MASGAGTVTVGHHTDGFLPAGELVLVTDWSRAQLFQTVSKTATVLTLRRSIYPGVASNAMAPEPPPAASTVAKARFVTYYIDGTTDPAHPTLMVDRMGGLAAQPLADDIEDMQLTYGLDTNGNGVVESGSRRAQPILPRSGRSGSNSSRGRASRRRGGRRHGRRSANRAAGTTPDGYRRRTYDIVIDVRNSGV